MTRRTSLEKALLGAGVDAQKRQGQIDSDLTFLLGKLDEFRTLVGHILEAETVQFFAGEAEEREGIRDRFPKTVWAYDDKSAIRVKVLFTERPDSVLSVWVSTVLDVFDFFNMRLVKLSGDPWPDSDEPDFIGTRHLVATLDIDGCSESLWARGGNCGCLIGFIQKL